MPVAAPTQDYPPKVAKGLLMVRRAVSARSGRATAYSETGPYPHQRYRYHQISPARLTTRSATSHCTISPHIGRNRQGLAGATSTIGATTHPGGLLPDGASHPDTSHHVRAIGAPLPLSESRPPPRAWPS